MLPANEAYPEEAAIEDPQTNSNNIWQTKSPKKYAALSPTVDKQNKSHPTNQCYQPGLRWKPLITGKPIPSTYKSQLYCPNTE